MSQSNIIIVGGGPVGATLALSLARQGVPFKMLEARAKGASHQDQRALALSYGSRLILEKLGLWHRLEQSVTSIKTIHISQRGSWGRTRLKAEEHGIPALGYVVAYGALSAALDEALSDNGDITYEAEVLGIRPCADFAEVTFRHGDLALTELTSLAILADGGRSLGDIPGLQKKTKEYGHDALVSKVKAELPHDNIAYERFTPEGPMALLPNGPRDFSLVWTGEQEAINRIATLDDAEFLKQLHTHFGDRVGRFLAIERRIRFPLKLSYLDPVTAPHLVVIGNAAQTMHPVAGQGFNVGMRDAWELAQQIGKTPPSNWGSSSMFAAYQESRKRDTKRGLMFTDFLVNVFSNDIVGIGPLRSAGLGLLDVLPSLKQRLVSKMSYGSRG